MNEPPSLLSLDKLKTDSVALENQLVHVRGFLYRLDDGSWILACQPNLKSCCVSKQPTNQRLHISGDLGLETPQQVVELEGKLRIAFAEQIPMYHLDEARLVKATESSPTPWGTIVGVLLVCFLGFSYRYWLRLSHRGSRRTFK